ncbi:MAG: hypothetical protein IJT13_03135 [Bacteroidaceae bacterium]|nr:hypothetical protein [Bacteroidaceae bacterium]
MAHLLGHRKRNRDLLAQADDIIKHTDRRHKQILLHIQYDKPTLLCFL